MARRKSYSRGGSRKSYRSSGSRYRRSGSHRSGGGYRSRGRSSGGAQRLRIEIVPGQASSTGMFAPQLPGVPGTKPVTPPGRAQF